MNTQKKIFVRRVVSASAYRRLRTNETREQKHSKKTTDRKAVRRMMMRDE
jgi:hypothetical protein